MEYDRFGLAIAGEHGQFARSLQSIFASTRLAGAHGVFSKAYTQAHQLAQRFVGAADVETTTYLNQTLGGALTNELGIYKGAVLMRSLRSVALGNVESMLRQLRGSRDTEAALTRGVGMFAALTAQRRDTLVFESKDSAGRTWQSEKLVRFIARDFAYQVQLDGSAQSLLAAGRTLAQVTYMNPEHDSHGLVVSLTGEHKGIPSLESVRPTIFHPNATALLTHVLS